MKYADFKIGTEFFTCTGQCWRCTDVGTRTILAIELNPELESSWFNGPPYAVIEVPFDEYDIKGAYRDEKEAIQEAIDRANHSAHPNFPHEIVMTMLQARCTEAADTYPQKQLFRIDRVSADGEILHPYAAERDGDSWRILVYRLFAGTFQTVAEADFIQLRPAGEADFRRQSSQLRRT